MNQNRYIKTLNSKLSEKYDELLEALIPYRKIIIEDSDAAFIEVEIDIDLFGNEIPLNFSVISVENYVSQVIEHEDLPQTSKKFSSDLIPQELTNYELYNFEIHPLLRDNIAKWFAKAWNSGNNLFSIHYNSRFNVLV